MYNDEQLYRLLRTSSGNPLDIHYALYTEFIAKSEAPDKTLKSILEYQDTIGNTDDDAPTNMSKEEVAEYLFIYHDLIDAIIQNLIDQNFSEEDFYKKLYNNLFVLDILPHDDKDQAILLYILTSQTSGRLPYYYAKDLLIMSDDNYKNIVDKIEDKISIAIYMLKRNFKSKTEEATPLWDISSSLQSREEQIVFWAVIISVIRRLERKSNEPFEKETEK